MLTNETLVVSNERDLPTRRQASGSVGLVERRGHQIHADEAIATPQGPRPIYELLPKGSHVLR